MARKSPQPSGPGTGMIVALVFFVLSTVGMGVLAYVFYSGQTELEGKLATADAAKKSSDQAAGEATARANTLRVAIGSASPTERQDLAGAGRTFASAIADEIKNLQTGIGAGFSWPLAQDGSGPAPSPAKSVIQLVKDTETRANDAERRAANEGAARRKAEDAKASAEKRADDQKTAFDAQIADNANQLQQKLNAMNVAFAQLKQTADSKGIDFKAFMDKWSAEKVALEEKNADQVKLTESVREQLNRLKNADPSDLVDKFAKLDLARIEERKGTIAEKGDTFVTIRFSQRLNLIPGQNFVVIPSTGSLVEVIDREKDLEKRHHSFAGLGARDPFSDNEFIKGTVEITEVTGPYTARARITSQGNAVRNPISRGDQLFNIAMGAATKDHVAFAGIIDLDGDGLPNNEEFIRILERNNIVIDAYLDLKTGTVKGKGMDYKTKFLIIGSDAPAVGEIKNMVKTANDKGVQLIDARRFLALIGVKPPTRPAKPEYGQQNLGEAGAAAAPAAGAKN